jgi:hypothetical protein
MVDYETADGTATAGSDYTAIGTTTLTFNPGVTTQPVVVTISEDLLDEADETYFVNLSNPMNAMIGDAQGQGTITDNDLPPSLSIDDVTVSEAAGTANFTVTLSAASGQTVMVDYQTADDTATAGSDYTAIGTTTLTFNPGVLTQPVAVTISEDLLDEADETYFVNLSNAVNAMIGDAQGQGTISDNDPLAPPAEVAISVETIAVGWSPVPGGLLYHLYRGDLATLKATGVYTQDTAAVPGASRMCGRTVSPENDPFQPPLGEAVFYLVTADNGLAEGSLGRNSAGVERANDNSCR